VAHVLAQQPLQANPHVSLTATSSFLVNSARYASSSTSQPCMHACTHTQPTAPASSPCMASAEAAAGGWAGDEQAAAAACSPSLSNCSIACAANSTVGCVSLIPVTLNDAAHPPTQNASEPAGPAHLSRLPLERRQEVEARRCAAPRSVPHGQPQALAHPGRGRVLIHRLREPKHQLALHRWGWGG
jgi:hypothetical protein